MSFDATGSMSPRPPKARSHAVNFDHRPARRLAGAVSGDALRPRGIPPRPAEPGGQMIGRLDRLLVGAVARMPFRVQTKLLAAFLAIAALLIVVGAAGLQVVTGVNERTVELIRSERKIAAYRQGPPHTTSQLYRAPSSLLPNNRPHLRHPARPTNPVRYAPERPTV